MVFALHIYSFQYQKSSAEGYLLHTCTYALEKNPLLLFQKRLVMSSITIAVSSIQSQSKRGGHIYTYIEEKSKTDPFERPSFFGLFCSQLPLLYLLVSVAKRDKMPPFDFNVQICFPVFYNTLIFEIHICIYITLDACFIQSINGSRISEYFQEIFQIVPCHFVLMQKWKSIP